MAEPVDAEGSPRLPFAVVGIGASAGGLEAFLDFLKILPPDTGMAFVFIQHLPPDRESMLAEILGKHTRMPVLQVKNGMAVEPDHLYVIRPGRTLTIRHGHLHLSEPLETRGHQHPVDDFFRSLAEEQRERAIAIVMSGMGSNGSAGAQEIKAVGGVCVAQDPDSAKFPSMPRCLIDSGMADFILRPEQIPEVLLSYSRHPYANGRSDAEIVLRRERQAFLEIMTLLRTRSRRDFSGYKKPTVLRRIQRRMGLHQLLELEGYVKLLRQSPSEATALSDDLVIHVTGFFRDREVWETFRERVIVPLVAERDTGSVIRVWVTACSSGEEAYTLAMLLSEAADAAHKVFEIKIFATDLAERVLAQARSGIYPQGIESEISPERIDRFFDKEQITFRVKKELREMIVFSPQNVLKDPPFSRLDICTCRNLLIYLEPEVQRRVLALMHFGLREGGALMLGTSETVSGVEELFESLDKKARIYRRTGPTRHGQVDFPLMPPTRVESGGLEPERGIGRNTRASMAHIAQRALLERFTPPAVVVDRQHRIVFFHGDTSPYLNQPPGEPTREILLVAREGVRGAVRVALHKAAAESTLSISRDGFLDTPGGRVRVAVSVAPLDDKSLPGFMLVSFEQWMPSEIVPPAKPGDGPTAEQRSMINELQRTRDELQSTVEELQTSNEELKASNEEVTSVNEEFQSTNEELETSKEELQSLNEELSTVNAQLQSKMEELESTSNDLSSLLSSADIGVIFLDTRLRIRRYTPAVLALFELIPSDLGRPLSDLSQKFTDANLLVDTQAVLAKLVPIEREISNVAGQWFLRRVLPYRTMDNRIDGVVVTFVDISRRRLAEVAQSRSEERYRLIVQSVQEYAIFVVDTQGVVTVWNAGAERILGFTEGEAIGQPFRFIFTAEDRAAGMHDAELARAREAGQSVDERWHMRKGGERFWGSGIFSALRDPNGQLVGYVKVMRDNTDNKKADEELHMAYRSAEAANSAKDQFLATISHELRTPLSAILLWAQMMNGETINEKILRDGVTAILQSAGAQKQLIDDLLDTSRIASGKMRLAIRPTSLGQIIRSGIDAVLPAAEAKGIKIAAPDLSGLGNVRADPDRLQQVMWNLLSNAVKFTPRGGRVDVSVVRKGARVEIRVADTGRGIDGDFLPHVFEAFKQADGVQTRSQGGLGLGLAICKELVELHGGTIDVRSDGQDKGCTFIVHLPLPRITLAESEAADKTALPGDSGS